MSEKYPIYSEGDFDERFRYGIGQKSKLMLSEQYGMHFLLASDNSIIFRLDALRDTRIAELQAEVDKWKDEWRVEVDRVDRMRLENDSLRELGKHQANQIGGCNTRIATLESKLSLAVAALEKAEQFCTWLCEDSTDAAHVAKSQRHDFRKALEEIKK